MNPFDMTWFLLKQVGAEAGTKEGLGPQEPPAEDEELATEAQTEAGTTSGPQAGVTFGQTSKSIAFDYAWSMLKTS